MVFMLLASGLYADGIKLIGGLNLLKYSYTLGESETSWGYSPGFCGGAGFEFDLSESAIFTIEIDGLLMQRKGSMIVDSDSPELNSSYSLSFLCIPLLAQFRFKSNFPFYVLGGGEFSLIMSHQFGTKDEEATDLKEETKTFDYGLVFGCGVKIAINDFQDFFMEARYHLGLVNLLENYAEDITLKNSAILFVLGIKTY